MRYEERKRGRIWSKINGEICELIRGGKDTIEDVNIKRILEKKKYFLGENISWGKSAKSVFEKVEKVWDLRGEEREIEKESKGEEG